MVLRRMLLLVGCCLLLTTSIASAAPAVAAPIRASSAASPLGHSLGAAAAAVRALEVDPLLRTPKWSVEPSTLHFQAGSTSGAIRRPRAISWTPARPALTQLSRLVTAAAIEPQLRYTLFAEQKQRSKQLPPHPIKICSRIHDGADSSALSCDLADLLQDEDEDVDDEGQPITFHLLTECVASVGDLHPCDSVFSAGLTVASSSSSFAPSCAARAATASSSAFSRSSVVAPVANISRITNDTEVRDDLARFYNEAGGPSWPAPDGWLQSNVSVCDWAGLGCDGTRTALISMGPISGLITSQPIDLSFLFAHVSTLQTLSFQDDISQLQVSAMDLSAQSNLQNLRVDGTSPGTSQRVVTAITLPNPCLVGTLYWSTVHLQLVQDWEQMSFPAITSLWLQDAIFSASAWAVPIPLLAIMKMSLLTNIYVDAATINASQPDGQGRTGGMLVHHWLENLDASHPQLQSIFFSSAVIPFDRTPNDPNNFPHFNSSTVTTLSLADLLLHTDASGASWTLPSLQRLMIFGCHSVTVPLSLIGASLGLTELNLRDVGVSGELVDLTPLSQLGTVTLESTGLVSRWPVNLSQAWSQLTSWTIIGATLTGAIASFADLSMLTLLQLSDCGLAAELPSNFLSGCAALMDLSISQHPLLVGLLPNLADAAFTLEALVLQENGFEDDLARFLSVPFPFLNRLELNNQRIFGELPQNMWDFLPVVAVVSMQLNALSGPIPAPSTVRFLDVLNLASNMKLNGSFPTNLTANVIDVSSTSLSGPLIFTLHPQPIYALSIAFTQITCPLLLPPSIIHLEMQGAAFSGCDFNNPQDVSLLPQLEYLDISNVQWQPFQFLLPPTLETLVAVNSSITSMVSLNAEPLSLTTLDLSQNPLRVETQVTTLAFISSCSKLLYLTMSNSSLQMEVADLLTLMPDSIRELRLDGNGLEGALSSLMFSSSNGAYGANALPQTIELIDVSRNPVSGPLPFVGDEYASLASIDLSFTNVSGAIPTSWSGLKALQRISVQNTNLTCATELDSAGRLACILPPFLAISESLNDDTIADVEYDCSLITIADEAYSTVTISSSYYHRSYCRCTEKYFGIAGVCRLCPAACDCTADRVKGCYPVTVAQPIDGWNSSASVLGPLTSTVSTPFIIPCPKSASGALLCNPSGLPWSSFYPNTSTENGGVGPAGVFSWSDPPDGFCSDGHTGRICSRCATGYFPSGRICLECASSGWNVLIIAANLLALLLLVTFLYIRSPSASTSRLQAAEYRVRSRTADDLPPSNQPASSVSASPLKLLIFHSQQLSILLQTMSSQPPVLSSFLSFTSSSSMGFSLSSLLALECFDHEWGIRERGWLSIVAMGGIVTVGGVIYIAGACTGGRKKRNLDDEEEDEEDGSSGYSAVYDSPDKPALPFTDMSLSSPSTLTSVSAGTTVASNRIYRVYGVCLSLLYFFLFPCLQTALSGLACTDSRQYHPSAPGGVGDYFYLNLNPWQACDSAWRSTILPPALIGTILWLVVFPVGSTILFRKMHHYLTHAGSQHTSVWPLCADLLAPYKPSLWYYEQLLLVRRILLVAAVTLIPSTSLYLPLVLFALVQVSAFIQHRYHPYASEWLNRGELISLYLLLINYITALLLQTGASASDAGSSVGGSINGWAIGLFVLNATFLLILIVGLFATMRTRMIALVQRCWPATAAPGKEEAASSAVHQASSAANGRVPLQAARKQELEEKQQPTRDRISKF